MTKSSFFPDWIQTWYLANVIILIPEWLYMMLRPHSLPGGRYDEYFGLFNLYATVDRLYQNYQDKTVFYIYLLGGFDILLVIYLLFRSSSKLSDPTFALIALCREIFVCTKTMLYLLYSYDFITPAWRLPVYMMNGQWVFLPIWISYLLIQNISESLSKHAEKHD